MSRSWYFFKARYPAAGHKCKSTGICRYNVGERRLEYCVYRDPVALEQRDIVMVSRPNVADWQYLGFEISYREMGL